MFSGQECVLVYDLVIRNASIIDGTGASSWLGDVAVQAGRIATIAEQVSGDAREEINAARKVLSPGFIDVHSHDDFAALQTPELPWKVLQGVTTEVVGNCGIGAAPFPGAEDWFDKLHPGQSRPPYENYDGYFDALEAVRPSLNLAVLAGHGALRRSVAPAAARPLERNEVIQVGQSLDKALDAGVVGMSVGLIYEPGVHSTKGELVELCRRLRGRAPLLTVHLRSEADALLDAVQEAIAICQEAGVGLQLSHHKAHGRNNWGKVRDSLALIEREREQGLDVWIDQYPYTAGSTILSAVMERGGLRGGAALGVLAPEDIVIASSSVNSAWEGQSLAQLGERWGVGAEEAAERILKEDPGVWVVVHAMSEDDVRQVLADPHTLIGSDGLPTEGGRPHPRLWGTFPRILGHYVRQESLVDLETMIARMSGAAARRFGLRDRGTIEEGNWADLVLFDGEQIDAGASFDEPTRAPIGIVGVWVNGQRVVEGGVHTGARPGQALRRLDS